MGGEEGYTFPIRSRKKERSMKRGGDSVSGLRFKRVDWEDQTQKERQSRNQKKGRSVYESIHQKRSRVSGGGVFVISRQSKSHNSCGMANED